MTDLMDQPSTPPIQFQYLGDSVGFSDAYALQLERRAEVAAGRACPTVFLLEHRPVITLGRNASLDHLRQPRSALEVIGIEVVDTDRGGDVTYHGPGQLVAYPILDLHHWRLSIRWYLRTLEAVLIDQIAAYGLVGTRVEGLTGVWVGPGKVAAIGVGLRHWVTFHGIALNVTPNFDHFDQIVPCGISDRPVTSLGRLLPSPPSMKQVAEDFTRSFRYHFDKQPGDYAVQ